MSQNVNSFVVPVGEAVDASEDIQGRTVIVVHILVKPEMVRNLSNSQQKLRCIFDPENRKFPLEYLLL